ncbi:MAG: hypothetical protein EOO48_11290, partial [Flavobacterium sp.]
MASRKNTSSEIPAHIDPMLCTLVREVPRRDDLLYELKWDGYRIVSYVDNARVRMDSRGGLDYTSKYPQIVKALKSLGHDAVIDGEVVVFNNEGKPDFDALQKYNGHNTPIKYCVFDLLWLDGQDVTALPLTDRRALLELLVKDNDTFIFSNAFADGEKLYAEALQQNLEGIVAKKKDSTYRQGERGVNWLKIPTRKRQEFVIGGWVESENARSFKSLVFGAYENGKLMWIGRSGGGYKHAEMPSILQKLTVIETKQSPFANEVPDVKESAIHWVKPKLVANFEFATWTKSGRIRKPATFLGFRDDKKPSDVVREVPQHVPSEAITSDVKPSAKASRDKPSPKAVKVKYLNEDTNWKRVDESQTDKSSSDFKMGNCTITLHDIERELWHG